MPKTAVTMVMSKTVSLADSHDQLPNSVGGPELSRRTGRYIFDFYSYLGGDWFLERIVSRTEMTPDRPDSWPAVTLKGLKL
jgi:hypothetical protein